MKEQDREYLKKLQQLVAEASVKVIQMKLDAVGSGVNDLISGLSRAKAGIDQVLGSISN